MIYLSLFAISCALIALGERKKKYRILMIIGLIFPILLAALRKDTVGIDITTYVRPLYTFIEKSNSLTEYLALTQADFRTWDLELGFKLISYFAGKISGGIWGLFTIYETIMIVSVFNGFSVFNKEIADKNINYITKKKNIEFKNSVLLNRIPIWLGMFCFLSMDYNMSLTMIRQFLACTIIMNAVVYLLAGKWKKSIILWVIAVSMHSTAMVALMFLLLYFAVTRKKKWLVYLYVIMMGLFAVTGGRLYSVMLNFANRFIPIPARYLSMNYMDFTGHDVNLAWVYNVIIILITAFLLWKRNNRNNITLFFFLTAITSVCLIPLSIISANAGRIMYYYMYLGLIIMPLLYSAIKGKIKNPRKVSNWTVIIYGMIYWLGTTGLNDITGTAKYFFFWQ